ncbi:PRC and DUF2382 domain-containing protein [Streptomyces sp. NPDC048389]|uniref:PRC and DUF2382 domain-containing protein n=1 Tax=Streptomyces sp. NPDC048389 TaxID=3154622 RepID=UPI0034520037
MITKAQIRNVLDHPVYDTDGHKVGNAKHVFLDDATGEPDWVSVQTGMFGGSESFVPIRDAHMVEDHLEVPYPKERIKEAPNVDVDAGGHLSAEEEQRLYRHYSIDWDAAWKRANQPGDSGWADSGGAAGTAGTGTAGAAGMAERGRQEDTDSAMTRSEETLHVGTERQEVGRARLRKYVVTEEQEQTIPLRHDEVRVEREPITQTNKDAALSGPDISEAEHEVTLYEERPVVETRVEPVERVRLTTDERTEDETVRGRVRKERIEADMPDKAAEQASQEKHGRQDPGGAA